MPTIVYQGSGSVDVEGFPPSASRSSSGALVLQGRMPTEVTEDELARVRELGHKVLRLDSPPPAEPDAQAPVAPVLPSEQSAPEPTQKTRREPRRR